MKFLVLVCCIWCSALCSDVHGQLKPIGPAPHWEVLNPTVKVSGGFEVGIMDMQPELFSIHPSFFVDLLEGDQAMLCVTLTSEHGQYSGQLSYNLAGVTPGRVELEWPTRFKDSLLLLGIEKVAVISQVAESCDERVPGTRMRVSSWSEKSDSETITLFINTSSKAWVEIEGDKGATPYPCKSTKSKSDKPFAYTCACEVPKRVLESSSIIYILERSYFDPSAEPLENVIELGVR